MLEFLLPHARARAEELTVTKLQVGNSRSLSKQLPVALFYFMMRNTHMLRIPVPAMTPQPHDVFVSFTFDRNLPIRKVLLVLHPLYASHAW
jgi:hypothetical protein